MVGGSTSTTLKQNKQKKTIQAKWRSSSNENQPGLPSVLPNPPLVPKYYPNYICGLSRPESLYLFNVPNTPQLRSILSNTWYAKPMLSHGEQHHRFDLIPIRELHNTFQTDCIQSFTDSTQPLNSTIELK